MPAKIPDEVIGQILAEADIYSDEEVGRRWGVSRRTIVRYRRQISNDPHLAHIVSECRKELHDAWILNAVANLNAGLLELRQRYTRARTRDDAECIQAIANSLKIVGELKIATAALSDANTDTETFP